MGEPSSSARPSHCGLARARRIHPHTHKHGVPHAFSPAARLRGRGALRGRQVHTNTNSNNNKDEDETERAPFLWLGGLLGTLSLENLQAAPPPESVAINIYNVCIVESKVGYCKK